MPPDSPFRALPFAVLALVVASSPLLAQGGPPLITDDTDTPGPGHWEINLSGFLSSARTERLYETPRLDLNYGVGRRVQLKLEAPWLVRHEAGAAAESGPGDAVAGVKGRFLGEEGRRISWSVYPQYEFNSSQASVGKGLVEEGHALLLPTEVTLEVRTVELSVELGRNLASRVPDAWIYGVATEVSIGRRLELLGEVHGEKTDTSPTELIVNGGLRRKFTRRATLMAAVGHAVAGPAEDKPGLMVYAGLQLNLPDAFDSSARY